MLGQTTGADYTIWAVALLLYVGDAAKLLSPRELLLVEAGGGRLAAVFSANPFTIGGRVLAFAPLLLPHRGVFVAPWGRPWSDEAGVRATLEALEQLRRSLPLARILAAWAFALLFVVGPGLTWALGPPAAVLYTGAVLYPTVVVVVVAIWWRRRHFRLTVAQSAWLSFEIVVCPAFLPNLVRKITARQPIETDGAQLLVVSAASDVKAAFLTRLESRAEELMAESSPDDAGQEQLRSYLATVRGVR